MIRIENLTKKFGQIEAVKSVSFTVDSGVTLGLLGPNGAGKTTIMRMITGYLPPSDGRVIINGMDMFDQPDEVKKSIGYLPEHPPLYLDMTVREYLEYAGQIRRVGKKSLKDRIDRVIELCGIADKLERLTGNLSKGYRQRVGLAQALVHDPDILILDEPTVGLDPRQIIEIRELIKGLGRDHTVILSTHILQEVTTICEKVAIINEGTLVVCDTIEKLSHDLESARKVIVTVASPEKLDMARLLSLPHVLAVNSISGLSYEIETDPDHDIRTEISAMISDMGAGLIEIKARALSLEEIFLKAVTGE
jgi:ABC-2 type transport system ATP-binding protein